MTPVTMQFKVYLDTLDQQGADYRAPDHATTVTIDRETYESTGRPAEIELTVGAGR